MVLFGNLYHNLSNIKTGKDLIGKSVAIGPVGLATRPHIIIILEHGWGILDKVNIQPLGFDDGKDALIDGLIDVAVMGNSIGVAGDTVEHPKKVIPNSAAMEVIERSQPYLIDMDKVSIDQARKESGYPVFWIEMPAGTYGPNQPNPAGCFNMTMTWSADEAMDEDVVYEITRIIWENADKFGEYHAGGKSITQNTLTQIPGATENDFHPGAVKFYKEKGISIGN